MGILGYVNEVKDETNKKLDKALMIEKNEHMKEYAKKYPETWEFIESVIDTMDVKGHPLAVYMTFGVIFMDFMGYNFIKNP
jgi:hypothetical protein